MKVQLTPLCKQLSIAALALYAIFYAIDSLNKGQEYSLKIVILKLAVLAFILTRSVIRFSFTRKVSQLTGIITKIYVPKPLRKPFYSTFAEAYGVIQKDMLHPYRHYKNFNEFFTRQVKHRQFPLEQAIAISPTDSKVLSIQQIKSNDCLLVKGVKYSLGHFLTGYKDYIIDSQELDTHYRKTPGSTIWSCILYLAPGDYHRYHSPVDFVANRRNHILGALAPVKEAYINSHKGVYEGNERVVLQGEWNEGFMFLTFVGATNVGSMTVNFDKNLNTNKSFTFPFYQQKILEYSKIKEVQEPYQLKANGVLIPKGAEIGKFNMGILSININQYQGSTVVIIFESKSSIKWNVQAGQKVRYGQPLFKTDNH